MASACLPSLHHAIEIEGEAYWDGLYSANPAVFPLIQYCQSPEVVVVLVQPLQRPDLPVTAGDIRDRAAELSSSATFVREMQEIIQAQSASEKGIAPWLRCEPRISTTNFHLIEPGELTSR